MILVVASTPAQEKTVSQPAGNLELFRSLAERIAAKIGRLTPESDSVKVDVLPRESAWFVESSIVSGLHSAGLYHTTSPTARYTAEFGLTTLQVTYEDVRRDGLFGARIVDRNIEVLLATKLTDRLTGRVLSLGEQNERFRDTIEVSLIGSIENPNLPITRGTLPGEGLFSSIAEPVILLGAIGVAIFLLFNVRS